ncbi:MAG: isoprenoid biosynthesis glyoxalase ElbB [Gammaproteobacteria bacterium]|nr:isoprenoid biosynthesis glyoxalase ElbB [Gammaproteobacteria bacterium]
MKKIAVILSGCGVFDGAEIHESVLSLLAIKRLGGDYQCFAPDITQLDVIDHLSGEVISTDQRNVLQESARIARGEIKSLTEFNVNDFDALLVPGGFGAAKNLSNFAITGHDCEINQLVLTACRSVAAAKKPAAYLCIAPTLMPNVYPPGVSLTIGNDPQTVAQIEKMGAKHVDCLVSDYVFDQEHNVLSTPAYMLANDILEASVGIDNTIKKLFSIC